MVYGNELKEVTPTQYFSKKKKKCKQCAASNLTEAIREISKQIREVCFSLKIYIQRVILVKKTCGSKVD